MSAERQARIDTFRQAQPTAELERKWNKAKGRHWRHYWAQEWIDLANRRGEELFAALFEGKQWGEPNNIENKP